MTDFNHRFEFNEGTQASNSGPNYKVYSAIVNQTGTSAPVPIVLQNTLGGTITWTRTGVGVYNATLTGAFTSNKTLIFISTGREGTSIQGYRLNSNVLVFNTYSDYIGTASDDTFDVTSVEIRVYT